MGAKNEAEKANEEKADKQNKKAKDASEDAETEDEDDAEGEDEEEVEGDDEDEGDEEVDPKKLKAELAKLKKDNAKLKNESIKRRQRLAELKKANEEKSSKGDEADKEEKAVAAAIKKEADAKVRRSLLRSKVAELAQDAHEAKAVFSALDLEDVDVDLDAEEVDEDEIKSRLDELRESKAWMFKASKGNDGEGDDKRKRVPLNPDGNGRGVAGKKELAHWKQLKATGQHAEAAKYYQKNADTIRRQMT